MKPITYIERLGILRAQEAVKRIVSECPDCLTGPALVAALCALLQSENDHANLGAVGIAGAALAMLVEHEREQRNGERTVVA